MKQLIFDRTSSIYDLEEICDQVIRLLAQTKAGGEQRIGYVAGIVASEGSELIEKNMTTLAGYAEQVRKAHGFPILTPPEVFADGKIRVLLGRGYKKDDFINFWRKILRSGYITDIFMTPRWKRSVGAIDEHEIAKSLGLRIHYFF